MKIYFSGSIAGGRDDQQYYEKIVEVLSSYGSVLTEHVAAKDPAATNKGLSMEDVWERDVNWMHEADVVIAEVTQQSIGVGYELGLADSLGKKVLCLYRKKAEKPLSLMISGNKHFDVREYGDVEEALRFVKDFFENML